MKKYYNLIFMLVAFALVMSCSKDDDNTPAPTTQATTNVPQPTFSVFSVSIDPFIGFGFSVDMDCEMHSVEVVNPANQSTGAINLNQFPLNAGDSYTLNIDFVRVSGTWRFTFKGKKLVDGLGFTVTSTIQVSAK